jgi:hypothetical protein
VHDNDGKRDEHLVPYAGAIDWDAAMMTTQKIGYDGVLMFEVPAGAIRSRPAEVREGARAAGEDFVLLIVPSSLGPSHSKLDWVWLDLGLGLLERRVSRRARKRDHVADVRHSVA